MYHLRIWQNRSNSKNTHLHSCPLYLMTLNKFVLWDAIELTMNKMFTADLIEMRINEIIRLHPPIPIQEKYPAHQDTEMETENKVNPPEFNIVMTPSHDTK